MDEGQPSGPVVVWANWYRFRSAEHIRHNLVVSVSFVWVVQGSGVIRTGGQEFRLTTHSLLRLPWRHSVEYFADERAPFGVGTIHVIPRHDLSVPVTPRTAYTADDPLRDDPHRRGPEHRQTTLLVSGTSPAARNLVTLGSYSIEKFLAAPFDESVFRSLGSLIMAEDSSLEAGDERGQGTPIILDRMTEYVTANLGRHLSVDEIASVGGCSSVTAERLFARHTGLSVLAWVRGKRMDEAASLLRTSGLRVNEVGRMVGFDDPLYFSRVFRATYSIPPSQYASGELRP
ncbi:MAG: transcriptional regulator, AraC family [Glaciihabitans sp.]|jgi:AraC-like DNA-binding protein|nr:transcriptional regulator, AraC family [Glaciihabitans sp.]